MLITNIRLFDGTSDELIDDSSIWIENNLIRYAGLSKNLKDIPDNIQTIDGNGLFVMPGMVEAHAHISYSNSGPLELDKAPVEESMIKTISNARLMLGSGFTSAISFGSVHKIDVFLKEAIERGEVPGPRILAGSKDLGATGSNADFHPDNVQMVPEGLGMIRNGPWELRAAVRQLWKNGAEIVKVMIDGEIISLQGRPGDLGFTDEEVGVIVEEAHRKEMRVACHARSAAAVKQAVKAGIDFIGHANYIDDEALDLLIKNKDKVFVGPAIAWEITFLENYKDMGFAENSREVIAYRNELEETIVSYKRMKEAGIRILVGGDYGLNITPHGTYAKDLEYYVNHFGFTNAEALHSATRLGGIAMHPDGSLGTLEEGKLADLIVIDGNPLEDITILQDHDRIVSVMKDGKFYKDLFTNDNPYEVTDDQLSLALQPSSNSRRKNVRVVKN
ncbi:MAG: amidohydrolase family protein [Pseudomonadota bacterium]|nr:amidohydrolase family protein [Pseudomonadota bacterium]